MKNIRSIWDEAVEKYSDLTAVRTLAGKEIREKSYRELDSCVRTVRSFLESEGFSGSHIALIGNSSPE